MSNDILSAGPAASFTLVDVVASDVTFNNQTRLKILSKTGMLRTTICPCSLKELPGISEMSKDDSVCCYYS